MIIKRKLNNWLCSSLFVLAALFSPAAPAAEPAPAWKALQALVGEWKSTSGGGEPGQATAGGFTFTRDLQDKVIVRKSFTAFAATKERPAFRHDDLTVITAGETGAAPRAIYFDSEGHTIEYAVTASADGRQIVCLSAVQAGAPRFRFTYTFTAPDTLKVSFGIAPPGEPDKFGMHVEGMAQRVAAH
jgi:hypothetical protein